MSGVQTPRTWRAHKAAYPDKPTVRLHLPDGHGGGVFTLVATINGGLPDANEIADLFAAAPDLLKAGQALYDAIGTYKPPEQGFLSPEMVAAGEKWCAAIAKAKGQP